MESQNESNLEHPKSLLALLIGAGLSMIISGALVVATAKAGISPGVSPLVVLVGWVLFGAIMRDRLKPFLAILQVTGSGGAAVSAGLIFTAPILQICAKMMDRPIPEVDVFTTWLSCMSGSLMGWGFVGLATKRFLTDPRLPAPEAVACDQLIQTAHQNPDERPPVWLSLVPALVGGFLISGWVQIKKLSAIAATGKIAIPSFAADSAMKLPVPLSPLYMGIGALLTLPTAILVFSGGIVNALAKSIAEQRGMSDETYRWVGGAAMVVAVVYSLINYAIEGRKKLDNHQVYDERLLRIPSRVRLALVGAIVTGGLILLWLLQRASVTPTQLIVLGAVSLALVSVLSGLGGLLSLQVGASASPVSGTVFMAMLVLSITAVGLSLSGFAAIEVLQPVLVASCVAIAAANDSSQDYKTIQLNGFPVSSAFFGQLVGCLAGACTVPFALDIAHQRYGLGSITDMPCPQASFFGTVLTSLFDPQQEIPWGPVAIGSLLGCAAVGLEIFGKRRTLILSSLAFAVGIYLPAEMGIGILLGNLAKYIGSGSLKKISHRGILAAAGLIAGDSLFSLVYGILSVSELPVLSVDKLTGLLNLADFGADPVLAARLAVGLLCGFLTFTYMDARSIPSTTD